MRFGRTVEDGFLPVFSTNTEDEAKALILLCCPRDHAGTFYARELEGKQTLGNLRAFSDRLARGWDMMQKAKARRESESA